MTPMVARAALVVDVAFGCRVGGVQLSDVGGDMVSSLESSEDLRRKIERRVA